MATVTQDVERNSFYLPDEILLIIFSHLSVEDAIQTAHNVCKQWRKVTCDQELWKKWLFQPPKSYVFNTLALEPEIYSINMPAEIAVYREINISCGYSKGQHLQTCSEKGIPPAVKIGTIVINNLQNYFTKIACTVTIENKKYNFFCV